MIDLDKMAKEHEQLFPKATLESQLIKLNEEFEELKQAQSDKEKVQEAADVIIVACGIRRWSLPLFKCVANFIYCLYPSLLENIEIEVARKWQINLKRKWEWNGKTYHHVEE